MRRILISLFEYVGPFATQVGPEIILNVVANNYILASLLVSYAVFIAQFKLINNFGNLNSSKLFFISSLQSNNTDLNILSELTRYNLYRQFVQRLERSDTDTALCQLNKECSLLQYLCTGVSNRLQKKYKNSTKP